jgi:pimeloyl-ACP methyl ester carboxylesterase
VRCHYDAGHSNRFKTIELKEAFLSQPGAQEAVLDGAEANLHPQSSEAFIRQCGAILTHDTMDRLSDISAPTHVIAGAEDIVHPARSAKVLAERIPGAELTIVPNVGHALCWEDPIRFNEAVLSFIARRPVAA